MKFDGTGLTRTDRLEVVDALRGFALLAIVIIHNLEHYNIYYLPEWQPGWLNLIDSGVWNAVFFLLAGKAFSVFSLLFGFSFHIQMENRARRGEDFRLRFAWRMVLLFCFAQLHALFYNGDILVLYAFCGLLIIPFSRLSDRTVAIVAAVLLLQPFEWWRMLRALTDPDYVTSVGSLFYAYGESCWPLTKYGTFGEVLVSNITDGQMYSNIWQIENGRLFQVPALFLLGMLAGRRKCFVFSEKSMKFWKKTLYISAAVLIVLLIFGSAVASAIENNTTESFKTAYGVVKSSYVNFSFMCVLVSAFTLVWFRKAGRSANGCGGFGWQRFIIPYGRMSLTNYICQSIIGCAVYCGYGLGLWQYTGATLSLLIGAAIFSVQWFFSRLWLEHHRQGPLEFVWKKLTFIFPPRAEGAAH